MDYRKELIQSALASLKRARAMRTFGVSTQYLIIAINDAADMRRYALEVK